MKQKLRTELLTYMSNLDNAKFCMESLLDGNRGHSDVDELKYAITQIGFVSYVSDKSKKNLSKQLRKELHLSFVEKLKKTRDIWLCR